jgi:hypothetical protein
MSAVWICRDLLRVSFANVCEALTDNLALLETQVAMTVKFQSKDKDTGNGGESDEGGIWWG